MKYYIFIFDFLSVLLTLNVCRAQNEIVLITELRYKNQSPVYWDKNSQCSFYYLLNNERVAIPADVVEKETYYPGDKGTEVILHLPNIMFHPRNQVKIFGEFYAMIDGTNKTIRSKEKQCILDLTKAKPLNEYAFKANAPLEITEPEVYSLTCMTNYINKKLFESSKIRGGFAGTVDALINFREDYYDNRKIRFKTLIDFYKLYEFLDDYAPDESFYNQEAQSLYYSIAEPSGKISSFGAPFKNANDTTAEDPLTVNLVYREYQRTYALIRQYYSQLQLILFFKSR